MQVSWRYQIGVHSEEHDRAKELLAIEAESDNVKQVGGDEDEGCGDPTVELPAVDDSRDDDAIAEERIRSAIYLDSWYPEDAVAKVWAQGPDGDYSSAIELALKENLIHFRSDSTPDGDHEIFVLPKDESRACEIVREIVKDVPSE